MQKIMLFVWVFVCIYFVGCGVSHSTDIDSDVSEQNLQIQNRKDEPTLSLSNPVQANLSGSSKSTETNADYSAYLKKIWVIEDWDGSYYPYSSFPYSFTITEINNGIIIGGLSMRYLAFPDYLPNKVDESSAMYVRNFSGELKNNIAECDFADDIGNAGKVILVFNDDGSITATLELSKKNEVYGNDVVGGTYDFQPYNLSDEIGSCDSSKTRRVPVEIDLWGNINLVTVERSGNKPQSIAFLCDKNDNILYCFSANFHVGFEVTEAVVADVNSDGLKDVWIISESIEKPAEHSILRIFYQKENGLFYLEAFIELKGRTE